MKRKILMYILSIFFTIFIIGSDLNASETINGYIIPISDQYENSSAIVNLLLEESIPVYQATESFVVEEKIFNKGDYIVSIPNVDIDFVDDIVRAYVQHLAKDFEVKIYPFSLPFSTGAYQLRETNVAVYFGLGTSAGTLWHINAAEKVEFDIGIPLETHIREGELTKYNVVTFPSGGFYYWYLGDEGNNKVIEFVRTGNGFHGTCGDAVYGVDLGLLDVSLDMEAGWPAAADLRGPIIISNEAPDVPIMYTLGAMWKPLYWIGQNFDRVGPEVTVLSKYLGPTPELKPYDPAISRAYGYYPNTEIINRFWGRAAAVSGFYLDGKVVLTGTHPEYYPETQNFFINTLFYLNSIGPFFIDTAFLPPLKKIKYLLPIGETILNADAVSVISKIGRFKGLSIAAREQLEGLEDENEQITDAVGEFLINFLDDQIARSSKLSDGVLKMVDVYKKISELKDALEENRAIIPIEQYELVKNRIEFAQSQIVSLIDKLNGIDTLYSPVNEILHQMTQHKIDLRSLLLLKAQERESETFYQNVISLYFNELYTLHLTKLETEYQILNLSFEVDNALKTAEFTEILVEKILELNYGS